MYTHRSIILTVYNLSVILFFENSSRKASRLLFYFVHILKYGSRPFFNSRIHISWVRKWPNMAFSVVECLESQLRKSASKSVDGCFTGFSIWERNTPSRRSLTECA